MLGLCKSALTTASGGCPLLAGKRTSSVGSAMSGNDPKLTSGWCRATSASEGTPDITLRSLPSEVEDIVHCLRGFGGEIACVGLEAGSLTQWLTYGLRAARFKPVSCSRLVTGFPVWCPTPVSPVIS